MLFQNAQGAGFRASHRSFLARNQIIVAREVKPAVDEVQRKFRAEITPMLPGVGGGSVGGNTNLSSCSEVWIPLKGDDVGGGGVVEKISVQPSERRVGEDDEG